MIPSLTVDLLKDEVMVLLRTEEKTGFLHQDLLGDLTIHGCSFGTVLMTFSLAVIAMSCEGSLGDTSGFLIPVSAHMFDFGGLPEDP
jgi:hypothetical protein